jgi:hypothetical protein
LWFDRGEFASHKERRPWDSTAKVTQVVFTQVWAAVRRKTLLLLGWIDGRTVVNERLSIPARLPREEQLRTYDYTRVRILSKVAMALFYRLRGYHNDKTVIIQ